MEVSAKVHSQETKVREELSVSITGDNLFPTTAAPPPVVVEQTNGTTPAPLDTDSQKMMKELKFQISGGVDEQTADKFVKDLVKNITSAKSPKVFRTGENFVCEYLKVDLTPGKEAKFSMAMAVEKVKFESTVHASLEIPVGQTCSDALEQVSKEELVQDIQKATLLTKSQIVIEQLTCLGGPSFLQTSEVPVGLIWLFEDERKTADAIVRVRDQKKTQDTTEFPVLLALKGEVAILSADEEQCVENLKHGIPNALKTGKALQGISATATEVETEASITGRSGLPATSEANEGLGEVKEIKDEGEGGEGDGGAGSSGSSGMNQTGGGQSFGGEEGGNKTTAKVNKTLEVGVSSGGKNNATTESENQINATESNETTTAAPFLNETSNQSITTAAPTTEDENNATLAPEEDKETSTIPPEYRQSGTGEARIGATVTLAVYLPEGTECDMIAPSLSKEKLSNDVEAKLPDELTVTSDKLEVNVVVKELSCLVAAAAGTNGAAFLQTSTNQAANARDDITVTTESDGFATLLLDSEMSASGADIATKKIDDLKLNFAEALTAALPEASAFIDFGAQVLAFEVSTKINREGGAVINDVTKDDKTTTQFGPQGLLEGDKSVEITIDTDKYSTTFKSPSSGKGPWKKLNFTMEIPGMNGVNVSLQYPEGQDGFGEEDLVDQPEPVTFDFNVHKVNETHPLFFNVTRLDQSFFLKNMVNLLNKMVGYHRDTRKAKLKEERDNVEQKKLLEQSRTSIKTARSSTSGSRDSAHQDTEDEDFGHILDLDADDELAANVGLADRRDALVRNANKLLRRKLNLKGEKGKLAFQKLTKGDIDDLEDHAKWLKELTNRTFEEYLTRWRERQEALRRQRLAGQRAEQAEKERLRRLEEAEKDEKQGARDLITQIKIYLDMIHEFEIKYHLTPDKWSQINEQQEIAQVEEDGKVVEAAKKLAEDLARELQHLKIVGELVAPPLSKTTLFVNISTDGSTFGPGDAEKRVQEKAKEKRKKMFSRLWSAEKADRNSPYTCDPGFGPVVSPSVPIKQIECLPCPRGTYSPKGVVCRPCPANTMSPAAATRITDCLGNCPKGYGWENRRCRKCDKLKEFAASPSSPCVKCPTGTEVVDVNDKKCQSPPGLMEGTTNADPGKVEPWKLFCSPKCLPGQEWSDEGGCIDCPLGSFSPEGQKCRKCFPEYTTRYPASIMIDDCIPECKAGYSWGPNVKTGALGCKICPRGTFTTPSQIATSLNFTAKRLDCDFCPEGKSTFREGATSRFECIEPAVSDILIRVRPNEPEKYDKKALTLLNDIVLKMVNDKIGGATLEAYNITAETTLTKPTGGFMLLQSNGKIEEQYVANAEDQQYAEVRLKIAEIFPSYEEAANLTTTPKPDRTQKPFDARGMWDVLKKDESLKAVTRLFFKAIEVTCKPGFGFKPNVTDDAICYPCPVGFFGLGGIDPECERCEKGWSSSPGSTECFPVNCMPGEGLFRQAKKCEICPPDFFGSGKDQPCLPCPNENTHSAAGSPDLSSCKANCKWGEGFFGGNKCMQCPANSFSAGGSDSCTVCPAGTGTGPILPHVVPWTLDDPDGKKAIITGFWQKTQCGLCKNDVHCNGAGIASGNSWDTEKGGCRCDCNPGYAGPSCNYCAENYARDERTNKCRSLVTEKCPDAAFLCNGRGQLVNLFEDEMTKICECVCDSDVYDRRNNCQTCSASRLLDPQSQCERCLDDDFDPLTNCKERKSCMQTNTCVAPPVFLSPFFCPAGWQPVREEEKCREIASSLPTCGKELVERRSTLYAPSDNYMTIMQNATCSFLCAQDPATCGELWASGTSLSAVAPDAMAAVNAPAGYVEQVKHRLQQKEQGLDENSLTFTGGNLGLQMPKACYFVHWEEENSVAVVFNDLVKKKYDMKVYPETKTAALTIREMPKAQIGLPKFDDLKKHDPKLTTPIISANKQEFKFDLTDPQWQWRDKTSKFNILPQFSGTKNLKFDVETSDLAPESVLFKKKTSVEEETNYREGKTEEKKQRDYLFNVKDAKGEENDYAIRQRALRFDAVRPVSTSMEFELEHEKDSISTTVGRDVDPGVETTNSRLLEKIEKNENLNAEGKADITFFTKAKDFFHRVKKLTFGNLWKEEKAKEKAKEQQVKTKKKNLPPALDHKAGGKSGTVEALAKEKKSLPAPLEKAKEKQEEVQLAPGAEGVHYKKTFPVSLAEETRQDTTGFRPSLSFHLNSPESGEDAAFSSPGDKNVEQEDPTAEQELSLLQSSKLQATGVLFQPATLFKARARMLCERQQEQGQPAEQSLLAVYSSSGGRATSSYEKQYAIAPLPMKDKSFCPQNLQRIALFSTEANEFSKSTTCFPTCHAGQRWNGKQCEACPADSFMTELHWWRKREEPVTNWAGYNEHTCEKCPRNRRFTIGGVPAAALGGQQFLSASPSRTGKTSKNHCVAPPLTTIQIRIPNGEQSFLTLLQENLDEEYFRLSSDKKKTAVLEVVSEENKGYIFQQFFQKALKSTKGLSKLIELQDFSIDDGKTPQQVGNAKSLTFLTSSLPEELTSQHEPQVTINVRIRTTEPVELMSKREVRSLRGLKALLAEKLFQPQFATFADVAAADTDNNLSSSCAPGYGKIEIPDERNDGKSELSFLCEQICDEGSFSPGGDHAVCTACPDHTSSFPASGNCLPTCSAGFGLSAAAPRSTSSESYDKFISSGERHNSETASSQNIGTTSSTSSRTCVYCPKNHFGPGRLSECQECPASRPISMPGSSSVEHCRVSCKDDERWVPRIGRCVLEDEMEEQDLALTEESMLTHGDEQLLSTDGINSPASSPLWPHDVVGDTVLGEGSTSAAAPREDSSSSSSSRLGGLFPWKTANTQAAREGEDEKEKAKNDIAPQHLLLPVAADPKKKREKEKQAILAEVGRAAEQSEQAQRTHEGPAGGPQQDEHFLYSPEELAAVKKRARQELTLVQSYQPNLQAMSQELAERTAEKKIFAESNDEAAGTTSASSSPRVEVARTAQRGSADEAGVTMVHYGKGAGDEPGNKGKTTSNHAPNLLMTQTTESRPSSAPKKPIGSLVKGLSFFRQTR
ncbi:unnamed protein product [Amoebophrya sp. A120]|nr:unnamed protein product [Amoebophrya sp. A120]|eukprot:GSA120T00012154001.1